MSNNNVTFDELSQIENQHDVDGEQLFESYTMKKIQNRIFQLESEVNRLVELLNESVALNEKVYQVNKAFSDKLLEYYLVESKVGLLKKNIKNQ